MLSLSKIDHAYRAWGHFYFMHHWIPKADHITRHPISVSG